MSPLRNIDQANDEQRQTDQKRIGQAFGDSSDHLHLEVWISETSATGWPNSAFPTSSIISFRVFRMRNSQNRT